jgi:hypothetical protein
VLYALRFPGCKHPGLSGGFLLTGDCGVINIACMNSSSPWQDWYRIMCHTYGTWLPGDGRGFRTRHHREHVEGDYKNPPPAGMFDGLHRSAQNSMKRDAVRLTAAQRQRAVEEIVRSFAKWQIELKILAITDIHLHALARVLDHNPRHYMGLAKKECSAYMKRAGLAPPGGLWAVRCECKPITDARHFENVDDYIADHESQGGVIHPVRKFLPAVDSMADLDPESLRLD